MIQLKKTHFFKMVSMTLIFLFVFPGNGLLSKSKAEDSELLFKKAKEDYANKKFVSAVSYLVRLLDFYDSMKKKDRTEKVKVRHGQTSLLMGACNEQLGEIEEAKKNYELAKRLLGRNLSIEGLDFTDLAIYRKILEIEKEKGTTAPGMLIDVNVKDEGNVIEVEEYPRGRKKKKFPWLLVVAGVVVTGALVYFLAIKNSGKYNLKVNMGEGVVGTPEGGTHRFKKDEVVNYNYSVQSGYKNLVVKLDGNPVPANGSITMDDKHTLDVSADKIGQITGVTVKLSLRFAATNLKCRHRVWVDNILKMDEILEFRARPSDDWDDAVKIYWTFQVNGGTNRIHIQHEAGPYYGSFYRGSKWIWSTYYELEVVDYTYSEGTDPGKPTLSEDWFYLRVAPWEDNPNDEWYKIKTKEIAINLPSGTASKQEKPTSEMIPKTSYNSGKKLGEQ